MAKFVNMVMERGKKSVAETIVYDALDAFPASAAATPWNPGQGAGQRAPLVEVKSRRVGGATYQVPVEVRPTRRTRSPCAG